MERQRKRRLELEEEKRALAFSPTTGGGGSIVGSGTRRRINFTGNGAYDSPRSGYSGTSSMYTDEKGLTVGVGGVTLEGQSSHMLLGGDHAVLQQQSQVAQPPRDLLDDEDGHGVNGYGTIIQQTPSQGEMSV
ncbi:hypothetical protein ACHAXR_003225 [Thalassiosira sp. AJA248-18]